MKNRLAGAGRFFYYFLDDGLTKTAIIVYAEKARQNQNLAILKEGE